MVLSFRDSEITLVLFCERDGYWKLADFGITSEGTAKRALMTNNARGTTCYRAPELVAENPTYTNKVDIWAYGCIMFEMCTGEKAFSNDFAVHEFRLSGRKPTLFGIDDSTPIRSNIGELAKQMEEWTTAILTIDPVKRPSAEELADDIYQRINRTTFAVAGIGT
jgi:serine/threonine protein kinase